MSVLFDKEVNPGKYDITFPLINLSSGVFMYQLKTSAGVISKKMIFIK